MSYIKDEENDVDKVKLDDDDSKEESKDDSKKDLKIDADKSKKDEDDLKKDLKDDLKKEEDLKKDISMKAEGDLRDDYVKPVTTSNVYEKILGNHMIKGDKGSQYITFKLHKGETIIGSPNPIYIKGSLTKELNSTLKNMKYVCETEESATVAFGCTFINSIFYLKVTKDVPLYMSKYNLLAYTDNMSIENEMILRCTSGDYGYVWIAAYGSYDKLDINTGESLIVNPGMFVCSTSMPIEKERLYYVQGPVSLTIQSKNIRNIFKTQPAVTSMTPSSAINTKKGFFSNFFSGGGGIINSSKEKEDAQDTRIRSVLRNI